MLKMNEIKSSAKGQKGNIFKLAMVSAGSFVVGSTGLIIKGVLDARKAVPVISGTDADAEPAPAYEAPEMEISEIQMDDEDNEEGA